MPIGDTQVACHVAVAEHEAASKRTNSASMTSSSPDAFSS
jgi:hypothetical protein